MGAISEKMEKLTVNVTSPDKLVQLQLKGKQAEPVLAFHPKIFERHDEDSLARQIAAVARVGMAGYQQAQNVAVVDALQYMRQDVPDFSQLPSNPKLDLIAEQRELVPVKGTSRTGCVSVSRRTGRNIEVAIEPGSFRRFRHDRERFAREIGTAVTDFGRDYRAKMRELRKKIFGDDIYETPGV